MPTSVSSSVNAYLFHKISPSTVLGHLSKLDVAKSIGPDGLSVTFLKVVADGIVVSLTSQPMKDAMSVVAIANQNDCNMNLPFNSCFNPETRVNFCFNA